MSDKSPRQGMSKKSGKSIKEKRAEKRAKGHEETFVRAEPRRQEEVTPRSEPRGHRHVGQGERAPAAAPPRAPAAASTRDLRRRITLEHGYGERFGVRRRASSRRTSPASRRAPRSSRDSDVVLLPKPQHEDVAALRAGQVLWGWPHCVQDPELTQLAIDRRAHPDRVRGDEPLDRRRRGRAARVPQEQRAGRLLLGAARPAADRARPATTAAG